MHTHIFGVQNAISIRSGWCHWPHQPIRSYIFIKCERMKHISDKIVFSAFCCWWGCWKKNAFAVISFVRCSKCLHLCWCLFTSRKCRFGHIIRTASNESLFCWYLGRFFSLLDTSGHPHLILLSFPLPLPIVSTQFFSHPLPLVTPVPLVLLVRLFPLVRSFLLSARFRSLWPNLAESLIIQRLQVNCQMFELISSGCH